jgi:Leucine-rich repeat (LRR) protein
VIRGRSFFVVMIGVFLSCTPGGGTASGQVLEISEKNITVLDHIGDYSDLDVLSISCLESLQSLPDSIGKLTRLEELTVAYDHGNGCSMNPLLPETIGNLRSLKKLILYGAQDARLRHHQTAERHKFPSSMSQLKSITYLDLGGNGINEIPVFVKDLPKLTELGFEFNGLQEVPAFLSSLRDLTTLRLAGNDLNDIPDSLTTLPKLIRITLGNNCSITQSDAKMKDLKRRFPKVMFDFDDEYDCPAK